MIATTATTASPALWPWALYGGLVAVLVTGMVALSAVLGPRHRGRTRGEPVESGVRPVASARLRVNVRYWRLAVVFVLLDLAAAFLLVWTVAVRELGWPGYAGVCLFVAGMGLSLTYVWRQGVLDWGRPVNSKS